MMMSFFPLLIFFFLSHSFHHYIFLTLFLLFPKILGDCLMTIPVNDAIKLHILKKFP